MDAEIAKVSLDAVVLGVNVSVSLCVLAWRSRDVIRRWECTEGASYTKGIIVNAIVPCLWV